MVKTDGNILNASYRKILQDIYDNGGGLEEVKEVLQGMEMRKKEEPEIKESLQKIYGISTDKTRPRRKKKEVEQGEVGLVLRTGNKQHLEKYPKLYDCHMYAPTNERGYLQLLHRLMLEGEVDIAVYSKETYVSSDLRIPICSEEEYEVYLTYLEKELPEHITYDPTTKKASYRKHETEDNLKRDMIGLARYLAPNGKTTLQDIYSYLQKHNNYPTNLLDYYFQLDWLKTVYSLAGDIRVTQSNKTPTLPLQDVIIQIKGG